jgi:hypothetical protein
LPNPKEEAAEMCAPFTADESVKFVQNDEPKETE